MGVKHRSLKKVLYKHSVFERKISRKIFGPTKEVNGYLATHSIEIPTRCSFVVGFIIPKFIEGSTCFERHTAQHQEL
jgi:hypothetical protein